MRLFLVILIFLTCNTLKSQGGFIQAYDLGEQGMTFHNMLLVEDTLVICGTVAVEEFQQWGLLFLKMDTLCNVLDYKIHLDTLGDNYSFEQGYEMIKTSEGGYALVGRFFQRNTPNLVKLDVNGDLEFVKEYPDTTVFTIRHWNIVEIENGYISVGVKQQADDGKHDTFIMRTDKNGDKVWEISYGETGLYDSFRGIKKLGENEFLLTGASSIGNFSVPTNYDNWKISKALIIDTLGNITWEWEGALEYADNSQSSPIHLFLAPDGNWVHEGGYVDVITNTESAYQGEIVKRDTDFNIIWSTRFGQPTSNKNNFIDLAQTPDGGWVAAGQYLHEIPFSFPPNGWLGGWLAKVDADGDSLWSRVDTVFWHPEESSINYLSGVVALPSGGIIACGHLNRFAPLPAKSFGWLIKVDRHGCIEEGCNPATGGTNLTPLLRQLEVFPNPATDRLHISGQGIFDVKLYDLSGRTLVDKPGVHGGTSLDLGQLGRGIYFVRLNKGSAVVTKKVVKE